MKKYTIKDSLGNKKVIYAENVDHAIRLLNDSKITDVRLEKGDWFTIRNDNYTIYKVIDDHTKTAHDYGQLISVEKYQIDIDDNFNFKIYKRGREQLSLNDFSSDIVRFNSSNEAIDWLKRKIKITEHLISGHNSKTNDSKMKDKSIHHEWLIEHAKRLYEYARIDDFRSVKREAENLIDGIDINNLG